MADDDGRRLVNLLADMEEQEALALARRMLDEGFDPMRILELCREATQIVGKRYEAQDYFLPELMLVGEMLSEIGAMAKPLIQDARAGTPAATSKGTVLIGTVHGDLHDIGKNIVCFMLETSGYRVVDLGIDVPVKQFIAAVRDNDPAVIGLSGFLTLAFDAMKETIEAIEAEGLREGRKIMIGGGQVDERVCSFTGADAFGTNAVEAVALCNAWLAA